ncbi:MAG: ABC transporter substrate-binding protein [Firmicutes bacterium]|nr:ABC transporter substrate-binding protein [Bacillota bacterium]
MKKVVQMFVGALLVAFILIYITAHIDSLQGYSSADIITIYNWGDYLDPDLIAAFEEETGLKVIYQTFESNEAMMTKLAHKGSTFDVVIPSDYAINRMKEEGLLIPLDHSLLPNLEYIDPRFLDLPFDEGNKYSAPYFWGTLGIVYNPELLGGRHFESWHDLWDESLENEIILVDSAREIIGLGLNALGYSLNETNIDRLMEAQGKLKELVPNVKAIVGDELKVLLVNEEAAVGVVWSGDAAGIIEENPRLDYVIPMEGTNVWFDNIVIPRTATNVLGAHQFIDFILDPENAAVNTDYVGYSTPNVGALEFLDEVGEDERFYPGPEITDKLELYENLGKSMLAVYNELFLEFKMFR